MPVGDIVAPVGDAWPKLSDMVEVEEDGSPEASAGMGPDLAYEVNRASDDAS